MRHQKEHEDASYFYKHLIVKSFFAIRKLVRKMISQVCWKAANVCLWGLRKVSLSQISYLLGFPSFLLQTVNY